MNWGARKSSVFGRSDQIEQRIVPILYARYFKYTCYSVYYSVQNLSQNLKLTLNLNLTLTLTQSLTLKIKWRKKVILNFMIPPTRVGGIIKFRITPKVTIYRSAYYKFFDIAATMLSA